MVRYLRAVWDPAGERFLHGDCGEFSRLCLDLLSEDGPAARCVRESTRHGLIVDLPGDTWVIGDVHGNFADLVFFLSEILPLGDVRLTSCRLLALGDYVDRGPHSLECVALLLALKVLSPTRVCMLRGNHEDPLVNGDVGVYGPAGSFRAQVEVLLGPELGGRVWHSVNAAVFPHLPLCAVVDARVFCAHGGIPRPAPGGSTAADALALLRQAGFPRYHSLFPEPPAPAPREWHVAIDLMWMDPADAGAVLDADGFGAGPRGGPARIFGGEAAGTFLAAHKFEYVARAHQEKEAGVKLSHNRRVVTVFSTSNYLGKANAAGILFIPATARPATPPPRTPPPRPSDAAATPPSSPPPSMPPPSAPPPPAPSPVPRLFTVAPRRGGDVQATQPRTVPGWDAPGVV